MANVIRVTAREFDEALRDAYPRRRRKHKSMPVSLEFYEAVSLLAVIEAKHGKFQNVLNAIGNWPHQVQIDGAVLARTIRTYSADDHIDLHAEPDALIIYCGNSKVQLIRLDGKGKIAIERSLENPDPRHMGMPEGIDTPLQPNALQKRTWDFSAHMVMMKKKK